MTQATAGKEGGSLTWASGELPTTKRSEAAALALALSMMPPLSGAPSSVEKSGRAIRSDASRAASVPSVAASTASVAAASLASASGPAGLKNHEQSAEARSASSSAKKAGNCDSLKPFGTSATRHERAGPPLACSAAPLPPSTHPSIGGIAALIAR